MKNEVPKIAILGWGSLLWEPGGTFVEWTGPWDDSGPTLPIEFSRISGTRNGALTLVIDSKYGSPTCVAWCLSKRHKLEDAVADLRCREGTNLANIGQIRLSESPAQPNVVQKPIIEWATTKRLDAVVWTALTTNFEEKVGKSFSIEHAISYIKTLPVNGKVKAAEYVWKAPPFVHTPLRSALQREPWFAEKGGEPQKQQ